MNWIPLKRSLIKPYFLITDFIPSDKQTIYIIQKKKRSATGYDVEMPELFLKPPESFRVLSSDIRLLGFQAFPVSTKIQKKHCCNGQKDSHIACSLQPFFPNQDSCTTDKDDVHHCMKGVCHCGCVAEVLMPECLK